MQVTLVDATALLKLILGEPGAEFVVNLFSRAEKGLEEIIITVDAIRDALQAGVYAAASALLGTSDPIVIAEKMGDPSLRQQVYARIQPLLDYIVQLQATGRLQVYATSLWDMAEAYEIAMRKGIPLRDALTLYIAGKIGVQRIASFSNAVRSNAPKNISVVPSL